MSILKPLPHDAAALHVSGSAQYTDDIPTPENTLHLVFGLSEIAHGRIVKTDLTDVKSASGVSCVLMAKDIPGKNDISPSPFPEPLLSDGTLNYIGQPIFICAATSHFSARRAAKLAKIEYEK